MTDVVRRRRKGLYPIKAFPQPLGTEAAGVVVALPTDGRVLADEEYKLRGLALGSRVAIVRVVLTLSSGLQMG